MIKHRLMLSAAAAVLLAQPFAARADITIDTATTTPLLTSTSGNITITSTGAITVKNNGAALVLNSNNFINNAGAISNLDNTGSIGILIDTSATDIVSASGLVSTNSIILGGQTGTNRTGVMVSGSHVFFGNITINNATSAGTSEVLPTIVVDGAVSSAYRQVFGSRVDGDITFGGQITGSVPEKSSNPGGNTLFLFDGEVNGNIYFDPSVAASSNGQDARGVVVLGGVHACSNSNTSASQAAAGYTCPTGNGKGQGALINAGRIIALGQLFIDPRSKDPSLESGSVMLIGNSIDGGLYNAGPATGVGGVNAALLSGNGVNGNSVLRVDPNLAVTSTGFRGPINIGALSTDIDSIDPGYSFLNRGTIIAQPTDAQLNTSAVFIQGASPLYYTCLGSGDFASCANGGLLNTGSISAIATTNVTTQTTQLVNATAFTLGPYAAMPRLDVRAESVGTGVNTAGIINALVSGTSGGSANAVIIAQNARLPIINVGINSSILATVETTTTQPDVSVANSAAPFTMTAVAISDSSGTLTKINNAGNIRASVTAVSPGADAVVVTTVRAIDLLQSTANGVTINNSGKIVGDVLFGAGGNNYTLNVGNTGGGGGANPETGGLNTPSAYAVVAAVITSETAGLTPGTLANLVDFGAGSGHTLRIGAFGYVNSVIKASATSGVAVTVENNGTLFVANTSTTGSLNASTFDVNGGTLGLTITQNTTATTPVIRALTSASITSTSNVAMQFGSFISSGTTAASVSNPTAQNIVLISAPVINISSTTLAQNNLVLSENLPFLFQPNATPLSVGSAGGNQTLLLSLTPRVPGPGGDTDATAGLGLSGDALAQFPFVASALATDPGLGAAIATSLTVYNNPGVASSKINVTASQQRAQQAFSQFGPDTSGGAKQVAIMLTDQATGPVAARQRLLRSYSNIAGDLTLWGEEFFGNINNKGRVSADGSLTNYKDHGFGFTLGLDSGSPRGGWYGGAFTFYSGDVTQSLPRNTKTQTQWYMLTGYTEWKGRRLFVDTQASLAYGDFLGTRDLVVGTAGRRSQGKRAALMLALGGKMGASLRAGGFEIAPQISLDGMSMREEGYTETGGGPGFNLQVNPNYANSFRTALGVDLRTGINMFGFRIAPEARFGYRYDLVSSPVKLKAGFVSTGGTTIAGNSYNFVGPDPDTGNMFGGLSLSAGTDSWHIGVNYDMVRGNNGSTTQVGTISLLGRI